MATITLWLMQCLPPPSSFPSLLSLPPGWGHLILSLSKYPTLSLPWLVDVPKREAFPFLPSNIRIFAFPAGHSCMRANRKEEGHILFTPILMEVPLGFVLSSLVQRNVSALFGCFHFVTCQFFEIARGTVGGYSFV